MSAAQKIRASAGGKRQSGQRLDLLHATEQEIVTAFANEDIVKNPPLLPASLPAAIELNRKIISGAMGVIDAWQFGGDSRLAPICTPGTYHPDVVAVLTVTRRMMSAVATNHETMARLFPTKTCEEKQA